MAGMGKAPAVHTGKQHPAEWHVELGRRAVYIRLLTGSGKLIEFPMSADAADRMAGSLHRAAQEHRRRAVLQAGDIVGAI